ncbi:hypothetical protein KC363_g4598 [Hortaea werneckii]|nr:hypothetical protein KC361_g7045 [Hortaea werneckii]KAI7190065.1 hypothetical protein KC363_g4598 [Hortaea werneckii]
MLLFTIAWSTLICVQTQSGLGTASRPQDFDKFDKEEYAVELLYLLAILSWKGFNGLSNAQVFGLVGERRRKQATIATAVISMAFLAALLASAFQCDGSKFWVVVERGQASCFDQTAFWATIGSIDIVSDILIQGLLIPTILDSKMKADQKQGAVIIIALYVATASVRLVFMIRLWNSPDFALTAAKKDIATFSQLVFPMSVLCLGKISRHLDLESYLSSSIGGPSRRRSSSIAKQSAQLPRHSREITTHFMQSKSIEVGLRAEEAKFTAKQRLVSSAKTTPDLLPFCPTAPPHAVVQRGVCAPRTPENTIAQGVGMVSDAVNLPDSNTSLSLTLIDGETRGVNLGATGTTFSTLGLYVGAPEDANLANQPPACSLFFQFQGQTFPESSRDNYENTTHCPYAFTGPDGSCLENMRDTIRTFEYSADSYPSWNRCEALAQYVEHSMQEIGSNSRNLKTTCSYLASLVSVTGGTISGPDVVTNISRPAGDDTACQPVRPQDYSLHRVAYAREPLTFNSSVIDEGLDLGLGGRTGYTPVVNVLYDQEDDTSPEVTFLCMRTYTPDGGELPGSRVQYNGASVSNGFSAIMTTLVSGTLLWFML